MRAPVSIVIPTLNAEAGLGPCLASLGEGLQAGIVRELVIFGWRLDRRDAGDRHGGRRGLAGGPAGRGGQLRRGVAASGGPWVLVLHADTVLSPGWPAAVQAGMARGGPGYFRLRFQARSFGAIWVGRLGQPARPAPRTAVRRPGAARRPRRL